MGRLLYCTVYSTPCTVDFYRYLNVISVQSRDVAILYGTTPTVHTGALSKYGTAPLVPYLQALANCSVKKLRDTLTARKEQSPPTDILGV